MPTTPLPRSAAAVNAEIRALLHASRGRLVGEDRETYRQLRAEWAEAVRRELDEAA